MKNKKLTLSVLSAVVVSSMASSAFAAYQPGIYVGGDIDKYYSIDTFIAADEELQQQVLDEMVEAGLENSLYVDMDGVAGFTLATLVEEGSFEDSLKELTGDEFETDGYTTIDENGEPGEVIHPVPVDGPVVGDVDAAVEGNTVTITGTVEGADDVRITVGEDEYLASEGQVELEDGSFTLTLEDVAAGDYDYSVVAINGEEESEAFDGSFTVEGAGELAVESVSAITNTKVAVTLKDAVKTVSKEQFTVEGLTVESATLSADGKVVTLVTSAQTPGKAYTVKAGDTSATWVALTADAVKPAVSTVTAVTNTLVQVNFEATDATEASILNAANYTFDNGLTAKSVAYVVDADGTVNKDKVYVTTAAQTAGTVYTLTLGNIEDESGNKIDTTKKFQFAGKSGDSTAPTLELATASKGNTVTVTFKDNSQLDASTLTNVANYTINGLTINKVEVISNPITSGNKVVKLSTSAQTAGTVYTLTAKGIKDVYGNVSTTDLTTQFAGTSADVLPPNLYTVTSKTNTKVEVVFDETVDEATATNVANYSIPGLTVSAASLDKADSTDTANYKKRVYLTTSAQAAGTVYTLTVSNIKDETGNTITTNQTYKMDFAGKSADTLAPTIDGVTSLAGNKVEIKFSEAMDEASVKTLTNYSIDGGLGYPTSVSYDKATYKVTLTTATQENGKVYNITFSNLKDASGNAYDSTVKKSFAGIGSALDAPALATVVALNERQVKVIFNKDVQNVGSADFELYKEGTLVSSPFITGAGTTAVHKVDGKTYILTLAADLSNSVYKLKVVSEGGSVVSDLGGTAINFADTTKAEKTFGGITDDVATPKVSIVTQTSKRTLEVTFENEVSVATFGAATDVYVTYDGETGIDLLGTSSFSVDPTNKKKVSFTFDADILGNKVAKLNIKPAGAAKIEDVTGNFALQIPSGSTNYEKVFGTLDFGTSPLKLSSAVSVDEQTIELTFNQEFVFNGGSDLTSITDDNFLKFINKATTTQVTGYDITFAEQTAGNKVRVYFKPGSNFAEGTLYNVVITDGTNGDELFDTVDGLAHLDASVVADATAPFGYNATVNEAPSLVAVTPLSATVVQLTYSESLSADPTQGTDLEFYTDAALTSEIQPDGKLTVAEVAGSSKKVFTVTLDDGVFQAGKTYYVKVPTGASVTDVYGVDKVKQTSADGSSVVKVSFGGAGTPPTVDLTKLAFNNATKKVEIASGLFGNALDVSKALTLEVVVASAEPAASASAEYTVDLSSGSYTAGAQTTTAAGGANVSANDKVWYRLVDSTGYKSAWVQDGVVLAAPASPVVTVPNELEFTFGYAAVTGASSYNLTWAQGAANTNVDDLAEILAGTVATSTTVSKTATATANNYGSFVVQAVDAGGNLSDYSTIATPVQEKQ